MTTIGYGGPNIDFLHILPSPPKCFGTDNIINANDVEVWAQYYFLNDPPYDINSDGTINAWEFGYLAANWNMQCLTNP